MEERGHDRAFFIMREAIITIFIPHDGCPYRCSFCNQWKLTAQTERTTPAMVAKTIAEYLASTTRPYRWQVAFYGGSFTALSEERQRALIAPAKYAWEKGDVSALRLSTRPDCISVENTAFLYAHGVRTVELGVQSLDDNVLWQARRGHRSAVVAKAIEILRRGGMQVGIQLLPGLYGETFATLRKTIRATVALTPDFVRIYPALVLRDTLLERQYRNGDYQPLTLAQAILVGAWWRRYLAKHNIPVIRIGLQATQDLDSHAAYVAGPYHPALGELAIARSYAQELKKGFRQARGPVTITYSTRDASKVRGHKNANVKKYQEKYAGPITWRESVDMPPGAVCFTTSTKTYQKRLESLLYCQ